MRAGRGSSFISSSCLDLSAGLGPLYIWGPTSFGSKPNYLVNWVNNWAWCCDARVASAIESSTTATRHLNPDEIWWILRMWLELDNRVYLVGMVVFQQHKQSWRWSRTREDLHRYLRPANSASEWTSNTTNQLKTIDLKHYGCWRKSSPSFSECCIMLQTYFRSGKTLPAARWRGVQPSVTFLRQQKWRSYWSGRRSVRTSKSFTGVGSLPVSTCLPSTSLLSTRNFERLKISCCNYLKLKQIRKPEAQLCA
jgi:hypothetical protein